MPERFNFCVLPRSAPSRRIDTLASLPRHLPFSASGPSSVLVQDLGARTWSEKPWPEAKEFVEQGIRGDQLVTIYFQLEGRERLSVTIDRDGDREAWGLSVPLRLAEQQLEQLTRAVHDWSRATLGDCVILGGEELEADLHPTEADTIEATFHSNLVDVAVLDSGHQLGRSATEAILLPYPGWRLLRFRRPSAG